MNKLIIILFIFFFTDVFQLFEIAGYGVTLIDIGLLSIYLLFFKRMIWDGDKLQFPIHPGLIFLLVLPITALISGFTPFIKGSTPQIIQYIKTFAHFNFLIFFTITTALYKIETKAWTNFVRVWLILSIFINLFGVYQIIARAYDLPLAWIQFTNVSLTGRFSDDIESVQQLSLKYGNFYRATSIFTEPSALASFNLLIQIFLIIPFIQKTTPFIKSKIISSIVFAISLIALFLCFSMTGFVGMLMIITPIFIFHRSKRLYPFFFGIIASILIIIGTDNLIKNFTSISVVELFSKRISGLLFKKQGTEGESFDVRLKSGKVGIEIWEDHFLIGAGLGLTAYNNNKGVEFGDFSVTAALAEMGLLGSIAFVGMFFGLFWTTTKLMYKIRNKDDLSDEDKRWSGILFYMMIHLFLINFISGNNLVVFVLWQLVAIVFANLNQILTKLGYKNYEISFVRIPLKQLLYIRTKTYLETKKSHR